MKTITGITKRDITKQDQRNLDKMSNLVMPNAGAILDSKYEIKREIARGGMGIVYEAIHNHMNKRVAIKVILADSITPRRLKRFQKELEAYSLLSHPNVITIHDAGVYNNYPYIVMEYIEGVDICTYVKQQEKNRQEDAESGESKGRDWRLCARLIYETALGLEYIHSQNMFHRDIKPANIIVKQNGTPVIIDLGLVKFNRTQSYNLTKSREIIGTIEYMPIEQAQGKGGKIDARTDVYSLGLVLYELLTGQKAYSGESIMELCYKIMTYYPPLPREIDAQIPEVLEEITIHATDKQKEKRYASMKEFADALKQYLDDTTVKPTPQYAQIKQRLWLQRNKNKVVFSCVAVLLVISIVIILSIMAKTGEQARNNTPKQENVQDDAETQVKTEEPNKTKTENEKEIASNETFKKVKVQDNAEEQFQLGVAFSRKQDYDKARLLYEKSAIQGYAQAQYNLGLMYENGKGVKQDDEKAVYWYEKVANQGDAEAQNNLGVLYAKGKGVKQDDEKAVYWYEKSAIQGHAKAQYNLGVMYYNGYGVDQDYAKAFYWWEKSAIQGHAKAQNNLGNMYQKGDGVKQDYAKAFFWLEKSAIQGYALAQKNLGVMYYNGQGVTQDYAKAFYWWEKSAIQGDAQAQCNLGVMYYNGQGVTQDYAKALYWGEKSAIQGVAQAQQALQELKKLMQKE